MRSNKILTLLVVVLIVPFMVAAYSNFRGGIQIDTAAKVVKYLVDADGNLLTAAGETPVEYRDFDLNDFSRVYTGSAINYSAIIPADELVSYPYMKAGAVSSAIVWPQYHPLDRKSANPGVQNYWTIPDNESAAISPVQVLFKMPENYRTGGKMVLTLHQDSTVRGTHTTTAAVRVGYRFFLTTPGNYLEDSAIYNKPVQVGTTGYLLSPTEVSLPISASESSFEAGKWVCFQYWRVRDQSVVDKLRHLAARFYYNPEY